MSKYYREKDIRHIIIQNNINNRKTLVADLIDIPTIEVSDDAISREHLKSFGYINKGDFNSVETIREWIDNAPSVIPKPKEGECPYFIDGVWCNLVGKKMKGADDE